MLRQLPPEEGRGESSCSFRLKTLREAVTRLVNVMVMMVVMTLPLRMTLVLMVLW